MKRFAILAALAVGITLAAEPPFTFVVLGDRTGDARPEVFQQILSEIVLLNPSFIFGTGDLIQGYAGDTAQTNAQWDTIVALLRSTGVPFHLAPGNHDIFNPSSESVYSRRVNKPFHSFKLKGSTFLFLDNTRWPVADSLPAAEQKWLDAELAATKKVKHTFVFMHKPYWRHALDAGRPELLHEKFKAAGVDYVFTGHDHFYCTTEWDSIRYFQVGPSGSRLKVYDRPEAGAFQNYLFCRVSGDTVRFSLREPGRDRSLPVDTVTYADIRALEEARRGAVEPPSIDYRREVRQWTASVTLRNVTGQPMSGNLTWRDSLTAWHVIPRTISFTIRPGGHVTQDFRLTLARPDSLYPLPAFSLPYEYRPGRTTDLGTRLRVRRSEVVDRVTPAPVIDGRRDDAGWRNGPALTEFGNDKGEASQMEMTEVRVGWDDSLLYVGARCVDSQMDKVVPGITSRDGKVFEDDNINLLLQPISPMSTADSATYYQVFVNPLGTIADRRCRVENGKSSKDYSWNGDWKVAARRDANGWTVEMSCPLRDLGAASGGSWGINACRFQARTKQVAVWQVPFEHDPGSFGLLTR